MQSKISTKGWASMGSILGIACFALIIFPSLREVRGARIEPVKNIVPHEQTRSENPLRLKIPKINVDASLESVGLTEKGAVGAPHDPADAAWFNLGPRPGESGSAIISGHSGWKNNMPAVFDNLSGLEKGDRLYIENREGTTTTVTSFVVRELRTYRHGENASDVFDSRDEEAHLNLVTCEGVWNKVEESYSDRLVVFADKE